MRWFRQPPMFGDPIPLTTHAFMRWFGNSVIRLPGGQPQVVYHGTRSPMDYVAFETGTIYDEDGEVLITGSDDPNSYIGPHFTVDPNVASKFAMGKAAKWDQQRYVASDARAHGRVIPVYLSVQRPLVFHGDEDDFTHFIFEQGDSHTIKDSLEARGYFEEHDEIEDKPETYRETFDTLSDESFDGGSTEKQVAAEELGRSIRTMLIDHGWDGIIYDNTVEGGGQSIITFHPGQVKSVFNQGTWDPNDENIML